jgi:starvation-inducible DNA-binding protein
MATKKAAAKKNQIGLDTVKTKQLADKLNILLANYQLFYINARGFHWNIKGSKFFELHVKFEELYNNALIKIDEIAERVLTLGHTPLHTFTSYVKNSTIEEITNESDSTACVKDVVDSFSVLLEIERDILHAADEAGDDGTSDMMASYIREQEKLVWMYSSFLK